MYIHTHTYIYIYTLCEYCGYGSEVVYFFQYVAMTITQYSYPFVEYVLIKNDGFRLLDLIGRISGTLEIHSSSIAPMGTSRTLGVGVAPTAWRTIPLSHSERTLVNKSPSSLSGILPLITWLQVWLPVTNHEDGGMLTGDDPYGLRTLQQDLVWLEKLEGRKKMVKADQIWMAALVRPCRCGNLYINHPQHK